MTANELIDILDHRRGPSDALSPVANSRQVPAPPYQIAGSVVKAKTGKKPVEKRRTTKSRAATVKTVAPKPMAKGSTGSASGPFLNIEMLPAGHGDCLWIEYGEGANRSRLLVDCGTESTYKPLKARVEKVPIAERRLELFILSHIDADHIGGAIPFFKDTSLGLAFDDVWFNAYKHISGFLGARQGEIFSTLIEDRKLPWNKWTDGKTIVVDSAVLPTCMLPGGMVLTLLSPTPSTLKKLQSQWSKEIAKLGLTPGKSEDFRQFLSITQTSSEDVDALADSKFSSDTAAPNGSSIAVLAEYGGKSVILGADAHAPVMVDSIGKLLKKRGLAKLRIDAFKVSHHASQNNLNVELMKLLDCPRYLISSNGSHFNHPDRQAIARCIKYGGENPQILFNFKTKINDVWAKPELQEKYNYTAVFPEKGEAGLVIAL
jgi:beta-lactamase superfamily II metal-dependent hydrolase